MVLKQTLAILIPAIIIGLGLNLIHPNSIPYIGEYRSLHTGDGPIVPPEATEGDPPFIAIDVAQMEHSLDRALFIDARDPSEFECATIPGAINIPFDYLPEEGLEQYFDSCLSEYSTDHPLIVFCSGEECDLSLHLGRNLQEFEYSDISIFFGGSREWKNFDLPLERRIECDE